jgi:hypothetical protein
MMLQVVQEQHRSRIEQIYNVVCGLDNYRERLRCMPMQRNRTMTAVMTCDTKIQRPADSDRLCKGLGFCLEVELTKRLTEQSKH